MTDAAHRPDVRPDVRPETRPDDRLEQLVETWHRACADFVALVRDLPREQWDLPTDLDGWTVKDNVAHVAHLEAVLAGTPEETVEVAEAPHLTGVMSYYTEQGVLARRDRDMAALVEEIERAVATRYAALRADPPTDGAAAPPKTPGDVGWDTATLLSNRPLDVWMHAQDVRRAIGRPGDHDSPAAHHVLGVFARALPMVVGKRLAPPVGTVVRVQVPEAGMARTVRVGEDGRAAAVRDPQDSTPTTSVTLTVEDFVVLAGGRRGVEATTPVIEGDEELGRAAPRLPRGHAVKESRPWTTSDIGDLSGRRALVTGVTSGIGEITVTELARHGAEVVMAARNPAKLEATIAKVEAEVPAARLVPLSVDLSDLASVRRAASQVEGPLHLLVNNAGVMATPRQRTADGLELQMATNHFGPFALTGLLLDQLVASGDGRVVAVGSQASRLARRAPLEDPRDESARYSRWGAYAKSKLADLMFVLELDRRARQRGLPVRGLAAHPGYSSTALMSTGYNTGNTRQRLRMSATIMQAAFEVAGQPPALGAQAILMAATADLPGSTYVGPGGPLQMRGTPRIVSPRRLALDREAQRRLWEISEEATGVRYLDE